jgi:hypothetical protein
MHALVARERLSCTPSLRLAARGMELAAHESVLTEYDD